MSNASLKKVANILQGLEKLRDSVFEIDQLARL